MSNISRRKFIYAGAGVAAAAGLGYLTKDYWLPSPVTVSPSPNATLIQHQTPQQTITETSTTTTSEKYSIRGKVFTDWNGNGKLDMDEEPLSDVKVQINTKARQVAEAVTDSSGSFKIDNIEDGVYGVYVVPSDPKFRWMCRSVKEIKATGMSVPHYGNFIENYFPLDLNNNNTEDSENNLDEFDIGLMEGFLTKPYHEGGDNIVYHVDIDPRLGRIRDYKGGNKTYEGHSGTDTIEGQGTPICAPAPGAVVFAKEYEDDANLPKGWNWRGYVVAIDYGNGFMSVLGHLSKIRVRPTEVVFDIEKEQIEGTQKGFDPKEYDLEWVNRGDVIGSEGDTGNAATFHLHHEIRKYHGRNQFIEYGGKAIDPFRNLHYDDKYGWLMCDKCFSNDKSLWAQDNTPHNPTTT